LVLLLCPSSRHIVMPIHRPPCTQSHLQRTLCWCLIICCQVCCRRTKVLLWGTAASGPARSLLSSTPIPAAELNLCYQCCVLDTLITQVYDIWPHVVVDCGDGWTI
jgi:hypothetical protein